MVSSSSSGLGLVLWSGGCRLLTLRVWTCPLGYLGRGSGCRKLSASRRGDPVGGWSSNGLSITAVVGSSPRVVGREGRCEVVVSWKLAYRVKGYERNGSSVQSMAIEGELLRGKHPERWCDGKDVRGGGWARRSGPSSTKMPTFRVENKPNSE